MTNTNAPVPRARPNCRWRCRTVVSLVLLAALLTSTASAAAQGADTVIDDTQVPDAGVGTTTDAASAVDPAIAAYAAEYGVTEAEAASRLDRIQPLQEILGSIRELESERVAGWGIEHAGTFAGWVWLAGDEPPKPASAAIATLHDDIAIRTGAEHSLAELLDAQDRFGNGSSLGPVGRVDDQTLVADYSAAVTFTAPDMDSNSLHIGIDPALVRPIEPSELQRPVGGTDPVGNIDAPAGPTTATDAELAALAAQMTAAYQGHIEVSYAIVDGRNLADDAMFDGGRSTSTCTSGFAARHSTTRTYGIVTAGHCRDIQRMHGVNLPWVTGYAGTTADAQFHKIPKGAGHELKSQFAYTEHSPPRVRVVQGTETRTNMRGDFICHTGKRSGVSCGEVTHIYYQPQNSGACRASELGGSATCGAYFVRVHGTALQSCSGDSGGPWYRGTTAYGIHKSSNSENDCTRLGVVAVFSSIDEVESFLGVDVMVSNNVTIG